MKPAATLDEPSKSIKVEVSQSKRVKSDKENTVPAATVSRSASSVVASNNNDSHPQYLAVMSKKVAELRKELKARGLEATGLKKDLQQRLLQSIIDAERSSSSSGGSASSGNADESIHKEEEEPDKQQRLPAKSPFSKVEDHAQEEEPDEEDDDEPVDDLMSFEPAPKENTNDRMSVDAPVTVVVAKSAAKKKPVPQAKPVAVQQSFVKSTAALFSPNKLTSKFQQPRPHEVPLSQQKKKAAPLSPFASFKKNIVKTASTLLSSSSKLHTKTIEVDESSSMMQAGVTTVAPEKSAKAVAVGNSAVKPPSKPASSSKTTTGSNSGGKSASSMESTLTGGVSSSIKEKQKLLAEARKQRLAEMRGKSKPVAGSASNSKLMQSSTKEDKRTAMNNKIREKHAALKGFPIASTSVPSGLGSASKFGSKQPFGTKTLSASNILSSSSKPLSSVSKPKVEAKPRSPMDTYEISDREESDSDESDCSDAAPRKNVPGWAQKENLIKALKEQYDDTLPGRFDPDHLFPEVETCDLEAIFDKKRSRYTKRTSSGNWNNDRVTAAEKLTYKRTMGYDKLNGK
jgi:hypothetical protein